ncbi:MAG: serine/threonine protein kinase [Acidobacteriota bacterium]
MTHASALDAAARRADPAFADTHAQQAITSDVPIDRRLSDSNQAWLGRIVDGRYRVLEVIGRGGMGVVYRVEHLRMGKIAAMKVLHRDLAGDPEVVQRFEREAAAISKLHHPHTVQVFDFGTAQEALYLIMEYVRGLDLAHVIERDGPLPWSRAAPLLAQICGALQEAHEMGVIHRDLKPENVLITRSTAGRDYAKVLDFGLAKLEQPRAPQTETGRQQIVGTPYFMSPEQIRGDAVDARSDIYSFGALMFELLTGQHLFTGSTAVGVLTKHLTAEADAPSMRAPDMGLDPRVDHLCRKALAKDPSQRWPSAAVLGAAIEEVFAETVIEATGPGTRSSGRGRFAIPHSETESDLRLRRSDIDAFERSLVRRKYVMTAFGVLLALGAAGAGAWAYMREPPPVTEEQEPNDDAAHANKIAAGSEVHGYLGKRRAQDEGDRDVFVVPWPSASPHIVTVRVTGIPNLDEHLQVTDGDGQHGAVVDEGGVGDGEVLHRRAIDGPLVITIGQTIPKDQKLPVENVSDPYTLTVTEEPADGETEPNGDDADANPLEPTRELRGFLDTHDDVDVLRWTGGDGNFTVIVRADGLPLVWHIGDGKLRTPGAAQVTLHKGELFRLERADRGAPRHGALAGREAPWSIVVTPGP